MRNLLPTLLSVFTGPRYAPVIEWSSHSWTHNAFRCFELVFGRRHGIRRESAAGPDFFIAYTWEAQIAHWEGQARTFFKRMASVRVSVPMLVTPEGFRIPASPYLFAIAFDATAQGSDANAGPLTYNHTVSGSDRFTAFRSGSVTDTDTGVSYNAVSGSFVIKTTYLGSARQGAAIYYLVAPSIGTNQVSFQYSGSSGKLGWTVSYTGCSQTGQPDSSAADAPAGASTVTTATTTVVASGCWLFAGVSTDQGDETAGSGTIARGTASSGSITVDSNGTVGTGSQSLIVNSSSTSTRAYAIFSFKPTALAVNSNFFQFF